MEEKKAIKCPECGKMVSEFIAAGTCVFETRVDADGASIKYADVEHDDYDVQLVKCSECYNEIDLKLIYHK